MEIFEIWELITASVLILFSLSAIFYITNPDLIKVQTLGNELSYIASLKSNENSKIEIQTENDFKISSQNNEIIIIATNKELKIKKSYLGNSKFSKKDKTIIIS